jgi:hypothetical protein
LSNDPASSDGHIIAFFRPPPVNIHRLPFASFDNAALREQGRS